MSTLRPMRRALFVAIFFVSTPAAHAAPNVSISPSGVIGQAPFAVTFAAVGYQYSTRGFIGMPAGLAYALTVGAVWSIV